MKDIIIRKLKKGDGKAVREILNSIEQEQSDIDYDKTVENDAESGEDVSYVAEHNGVVVGFMISYTLSGVFGIGKSAWLAMLGINPKYMGQGIGQLLAEKTCEIYSQLGIKKIYTTVRWDSTDLLSFFKKLGFDRSSYINLSKMLD